MRKLILTLLLLAAGNLRAEGFEYFLNRAVEHSPYLKASSLRIAQAKQEGEMLTRYENPDLEIEASYFDPNSAEGMFGYRAGISQPVRLWGVLAKKSALASANVLSRKSDFAQMRALFVRDIALRYTQYVKDSLFAELASEELSIADSIYLISKARYKAGTISRGEVLQAKIDYKMVQAKVQTMNLAKRRSYYALLKSAGVDEEIELDTDYTFVFSGSDNINPELLRLQNAKSVALANAKVNENKVEWMSIAFEYENEPEQDIYRIGASFPLALFNKRRQERQVAVLEASRAHMLSRNVKVRMDVEMKRLQEESESLLGLRGIDKDILEDEKELLIMFEEGYKIANINLLALQDIKSRLIETKTRLIRIKIELDRNAINRNYLQGNYND
jgi:cobalt-zinc-cadmium efflux system outer membrane protein